MSDRDVLRILLVGDPEVGKSSIISTYTSRHFPDDGVPSIIYDSKLPPDSTANGTFVVIMDSNARNGNNKSNSTLTDKILMADSIVCVYDVTRPETLESIANEWLPLIKDVISSANNQNNQFNGVYGTGGITGMNNSNNSNSFYLSSGGVDSSELSYGLNSTNSNNNNNNNSTRPMPSVIVAGNKTDLLNDRSEDLRAEEESELKYFSSLLSEFSFVKYCCRCSAKMLDVDSVFYYAENVITFPIDPLYDVLTSDFTAQAVGAFKRIFRLFDDDCDGYLSDAEIATLQLRCFQIEFANDEILALKKHIIKDVPGGLVRNKITFTGFLGMIRKFIEKRSNLETAWIILRRCGYANSSSLTLEMPPDIECLPPSSSFADACTVDEVSTWKRLVDRLKIPLALTVSGSAPRVPVLECMNDYAATAPNHDVLYSSEMRHQLSILQEQQQYSATGLCREAVQFLVSLCLVTEENTRRRYRREVDAATGIATRTSSASASGAGSDAGSNISDPAGAEVEADLSSSSSRGQTPIFQFPDSVQLDPRTQLLTNVLNQLTWNELSQESIEEIFSVLPRSSCVFPREPTNNAIGVAGSGVGTGTNDIPVSHPWNSPPLFTPSQQEVNTSSTSASTSPVLSLYCFNGYYSYSLTPVASVPTAAPAPPVSGSLTVDVSGGGESASTESIAGSPKESDLSALNAGTAAADTDDTDTDTDMDKDLLKKAPVKANNSTHGGLLYTTISMWIAHWQLLAMYEPTLVQKLLFELGYIEKTPSSNSGISSGGSSNSSSSSSSGNAMPQHHNHYGLVSNPSSAHYSKRYQQLRTVNTAVHSFPGRNSNNNNNNNSSNISDHFSSTEGARYCSNGNGDANYHSSASSNTEEVGTDDPATNCVLQFLTELNVSSARSGSGSSGSGSGGAGISGVGARGSSTSNSNGGDWCLSKTSYDVATAVQSAMRANNSNSARMIHFSSIDVPGLSAIFPVSAIMSPSNTTGLLKLFYAAVVTTYTVVLSTSDFYAAASTQLKDQSARCDLHLLLYNRSNRTSIENCLSESERSQASATPGGAPVETTKQQPYVAAISTRGDSSSGSAVRIGVINPALNLTTPRLFVSLPSPLALMGTVSGSKMTAGKLRSDGDSGDEEDSSDSAGSTGSTGSTVIISRHKLKEHIERCQFHPSIELQRDNSGSAAGPVAGTVDTTAWAVVFAPLNKSIYSVTCTTNALKSVSVGAKTSLLAQYHSKHSYISALGRLLSCSKDGSSHGGGSGLSLAGYGFMGMGLMFSAASATSVWYYVMYITLRKSHPALSSRDAVRAAAWGVGQGAGGVNGVGTVAREVMAHVSTVMSLIQRMAMHDLSTMYKLMLELSSNLYQQLLDMANELMLFPAAALKSITSGSEDSTINIFSAGKWTLGGMYAHVYSLLTATGTVAGAK